MAMNQTEASTLEKNSWFKDRVRICTSVYTNYLLNTGTEDPQYAEKIAAGTRIANDAFRAVETLMFTLSGDAEVQAAGPAIPDPQLQAIVEKTIQKFYPVQIQPAFPAGFGQGMNLPRAN